MAQWGNPESGILRKNKKKDNFEDLLVFGYACKIFKDDEKALQIDQGKHLIPWMGDEKVKIDRYDCRGHLSDISRYESSREGYDATRWLGLDENERRLEQLCDEERYYSLHINEEDEELYKEEEEKRNNTNEFQYSYDVPMNPAISADIPTVPENDEDEKYVPLPELDVPIDIAIPKTVKENARIEKTAMFVSTQGPQMEILIKAKQSDNPQFSFLNQGDPLYKFYRHVLNAIKSRRYQINRANSDRKASNAPGGDSGDHYLHPSLVSSDAPSTELPLPTIPSVPYRPNVNCAYSQLVNRIQGASNPGANSTPSSQEPFRKQQGAPTVQTQANVPNIGNLTYEQQQQYYQYYVQQQYYEYCKQMTQNTSGGDEASEMAMDPNMQAYFQQLMYAQYLQHAQTQQQSTNPYAQIVSNVNKDIQNPYPNLEKSDISKEPTIGAVPGNIQDTKSGNAQNHSSNNSPTPSVGVAGGTTIIVGGVKSMAGGATTKPSLLSLVQNYGSDSDLGSSDDDGEPDTEPKVPDGEEKVVIDKMACYVVKNGADFEQIVKSRADPRFVFLNSDHEFHAYYRRRVDEELKRKNEEERLEQEVGTKEIQKVNHKAKEKKVIAPVSFSIKKPKEEPPKEIKSALPVDEESDEEDQSSDQEPQPLPPMISQPPTLVSSNTLRQVFRIETAKEKDREVVKQENVELETDSKAEISSEKKDEETAEVNADEEHFTPEKKRDDDDDDGDGEMKDVANNVEKDGVSAEDDPILEMIDLTDDAPEEKKGNSKKCEDIFDIESDKEKTKDNKALQLERRRKALAFLKLKSASLGITHIPDGAKTTIPTIDLSNIKSPKGRKVSTDSLDEEEDRKNKRVRTRTRDRDIGGEPESKRSRESERTVSRKDKEKCRKSRSPREGKSHDVHEVSEVEEGEVSEDENDVKHKKSSSHKKKKSHKRKHSKSKHSSRSKKKSKKKETPSRSVSSDSGRSSHS